MACHILVYKQGSKSVIRGVECEFKRIELGELDRYLSIGYVTNVKDLKAKPKRKVTSKQTRE